MQLINRFMNNVISRFLTRDDEQGQTLVEYALIIALVSITLVFALGALSGGVGDVFDSITSTLGGTTGS